MPVADVDGIAEAHASLLASLMALRAARRTWTAEHARFDQLRFELAIRMAHAAAERHSVLLRQTFLNHRE